jgi:hypothetical protein
LTDWCEKSLDFLITCTVFKHVVENDSDTAVLQALLPARPEGLACALQIFHEIL